jgi:hypothetical protein
VRYCVCVAVCECVMRFLTKVREGVPGPSVNGPYRASIDRYAVKLGEGITPASAGVDHGTRDDCLAR